MKSTVLHAVLLAILTLAAPAEASVWRYCARLWHSMWAKIPQRNPPPQNDFSFHTRTALLADAVDGFTKGIGAASGSSPPPPHTLLAFALTSKEGKAALINRARERMSIDLSRFLRANALAGKGMGTQADQRAWVQDQITKNTAKITEDLEGLRETFALHIMEPIRKEMKERLRAQLKDGLFNEAEIYPELKKLLVSLSRRSAEDHLSAAADSFFESVLRQVRKKIEPSDASTPVRLQIDWNSGKIPSMAARDYLLAEAPNLVRRFVDLKVDDLKDLATEERREVAKGGVMSRAILSARKAARSELKELIEKETNSILLDPNIDLKSILGRLDGILKRKGADHWEEILERHVNRATQRALEEIGDKAESDALAQMKKNLKKTAKGHASRKQILKLLESPRTLAATRLLEKDTARGKFLNRPGRSNFAKRCKTRCWDGDTNSEIAYKGKRPALNSSNPSPSHLPRALRNHSTLTASSSIVRLSVVALPW